MNQNNDLCRFDALASDDGAEGLTRPTGSRSWSRMTIGDSAKVQMGDSLTYHQYFTDDGPAAKRQKIERDRRRSEALRKEFLDSLRFTDIFTRQESLRTNTPGTYQWVFTEQSPSEETGDESSKDRELRGKIVAWLRDEESFFWLKGKPGSGKSMLMSFLLNDPRTKTNLQTWAGDCTVHVFSFFFWKPGTTLQKTTTGLLRSLLFQIARSKPDAVDVILSQDTSLSFSAWHEARLCGTIEQLMAAYQSDRILFLIDGLDECEDDHGELVDVLNRLGSGANVKTLCSSRPEIALKRHIGTPPEFSLEVLNYKDILIHAGKAFMPYGKALEKFSDPVASGAEGVFLWAVLVCKSLVRGHIDGDDDRVLYERLSTIPRGLDGLFARMFSDVDAVHQKSLKFYLHSLDYRIGGTSIPLIVAALHCRQINSLEHFFKICSDEEIRIVSQSRGLIEIQGSNSSFSSDDPVERWALNDVSSGSASQRPVHLDQSQIRQVRKRLIWVHRSAYEYIHGVSRTENTFLMNGTEEDHQRRRLWQGVVWLTQFLPIIGMSTRHPDKVPDVYYHEDFVSQLSSIGNCTRSQDFIREIQIGLDTIYEAICSWVQAMQQVNRFDEKPTSTHPDSQSGFPARPLLEATHWFWHRVFLTFPEFLASNSGRLLQDSNIYGIIALLLHDWSSIAPDRNASELPKQRLVAIRSIMSGIIVRTDANHATKNCPYLRLAELKVTRDSRFYTWRSSGSDNQDEQEIMNHYVSALNRFWKDEYAKRSGMRINAFSDTDLAFGEFTMRDVLGQTFDFFDAWSVFVGMLEHRTPEAPGLQRMDVQLPIRYMFSSLLPGSHDQNINTVALVAARPVVRLCCVRMTKPYEKWSPVQNSEFYVFDLSPKLSEQLLRLSSQHTHDNIKRKLRLAFMASLTDLQSLAGMVLDEIWEDPHSQLTAWGRLYCRACFRKCFKHYWCDQQEV